MDYVKVIKTALDVGTQLGVPGASYGQIAMNVFETIRTQTGLSNEEILARAGNQFDENERRILANLAQQPPATDAPAPSQPQPSPAPAQPTVPATETKSADEIQVRLDNLIEKLRTATNPEERRTLEERITKTKARLEDANRKEGKI